MPGQRKDLVVSTPDVLRGELRIKNTRIQVGLILGDLAARSSTGSSLGKLPI